jgi:hypothetical protein
MMAETREGCGVYIGGMMDKKDQLEMLMLLSALESWGFSVKEMFPDYLHDELSRKVDLLKKSILEE